MNQMIRSLVKKGRHTELFWRYGFNFVPWLDYKISSLDSNNETAQKIITGLNRDGIVISTVDEFAGEIAHFQELESSVGQILETRGGELQRMKSKANDVEAVGDKTFNIELLGSELTFDPESIFARFALQETFLNIANAYFGMFAKLRYYNVWYTFATESEARESQLWHFDREDNYILKIFLYLKDVDEGTGPFTYAPETHRKGSRRNLQPEYFLEKNVRRTTDEQMNAVVPKENWIRAVGKKGTIVFADTRGYHKGGEAKTDDRLMFTCMFTSSASESKRLINYPNTFNSSNLNKKQFLALQVEK
jgi:hypothetical protein